MLDTKVALRVKLGVKAGGAAFGMRFWIKAGMVRAQSDRGQGNHESQGECGHCNSSGASVVIKMVLPSEVFVVGNLSCISSTAIDGNPTKV